MEQVIGPNWGRAFLMIQLPDVGSLRFAKYFYLEDIFIILVKKN